MPYTVVGALKSRAIRVLWMLEELEQDYEHIPALPRSAEAFEHHPDGKVPALLVDGEALTDSVAIITFLADRHGAMTYPAGTIERARQDGFTQLAVDEAEGALWTAAKHTFVLPEALRVKEVKRACNAEYGLAMERLAKRLGDGPFVMGERMTVPDILFGQMAGWSRAAGFDQPEGKVADYHAMLVERPAFRRAIERAKERAA